MGKIEARSLMIFTVLCLGFMFSYFVRLSTGVLGPSLMTDLHIDVEQLGTLAGVFFYAFAIVQIPVGLALDSFNPRNVIIAILIPAIAGCALFGLAENYNQALWGRILIGLGMSTMLMGSMKIFSQIFRQNQFAFLSGAMLSLGNFGGFIAAAPLAFAASLISWRNCFLIFAVFLAILALLLIVLIQDQSRVALLKSSAPRTVPARQLLNRLRTSSAAVFSSRHFWFISISAFIRYGSLIAIQGFLGTLYLTEVMGYSPQTSANILGMLAIGYIFGSPIMGKVSDAVFLSRKKVMIPGLLIYMCCMVFFLVDVKSEWLWYMVFFALGFFSSIGAVSFAHIKELFPNEMSGFALTANNLFNIGGVGICQQLVGSVVSRYQRTATGYPVDAYHTAFALLLILSVVAVLIYVFVKDTGPLTSA